MRQKGRRHSEEMERSRAPARALTLSHLHVAMVERDAVQCDSDRPHRRCRDGRRERFARHEGHLEAVLLRDDLVRVPIEPTAAADALPRTLDLTAVAQFSRRVVRHPIRHDEEVGAILADFDTVVEGLAVRAEDRRLLALRERRGSDERLAQTVPFGRIALVQRPRRRPVAIERRGLCRVRHELSLATAAAAAAAATAAATAAALAAAFAAALAAALAAVALLLPPAPPAAHCRRSDAVSTRASSRCCP